MAQFKVFSVFFLFAAPPEGNPRIEGLANSYVEGDTVSAKCISPPADPAPILSWYINGQQVILTFCMHIQIGEFTLLPSRFICASGEKEGIEVTGRK